MTQATSTQKKWTAVGIATCFLAGALISNPANASTSNGSSSRWSSQPSWATGTGASGNTGTNSGSRDSDAPRKVSMLKESTPKVSPFSPGSHNLSLDVGQVFLMGDLSTNFNDAIGSQVHYTYGVSDIFGFDSSLGYSDHSDGKFSMTTFLTGLRTNLAWYDKVVPYAVFGLGFYKPSYQLDPLTDLSPILFGVHLGPGVSLEVSRQVFFGASLTFHDIFGATKLTPQGEAMRVGGTYTSFFLNAGVTF